MIPEDIVSSNKYISFAFVDIPNAHAVLYFSNGSYDTYPYVDTFECGGGTLVCFMKQPSNEGVKHNFLVSNGQDEKIIQASTYESLQDIFTVPDVYPYSFYTFLNSVFIPGQATQESVGDVDHYVNGQKFERCDMSSYGPVPFYPVTSGYSIVTIRHVLSLSGVGHILHFNTMNETIPNQTSQAVNTSGRTLASIFKCVSEWAAVSYPPFENQETPSLAARAFIEDLGISAELLSEVQNIQEDMRVFRYLSGHNELFELFNETQEIPPLLKKYFMERLSYRTLSSLVKHHPSASLMSVDESILHNEKIAIETIVFNFAVNNGLNVSHLNASDIRHALRSVVNPVNVPNNLQIILENVAAYA